MDFKQFYKTIQFDIDKEIRTVLQATQGDTKSRGLIVPVVVNSVVTPVTTETMNFFALKPDGTRIMTVGVKDGDKFRIDFTNQTFSVAGTLLCALVLYGTNGEKIADKKFKMTVDSSLEDGAIISEDERGILDRAFDLASDIVPRLEALDVPLLENLEQEVITARGTEATLGARLDSTDAQLNDIVQKQLISSLDFNLPSGLKNEVIGNDFIVRIKETVINGTGLTEQSASHTSTHYRFNSAPISDIDRNIKEGVGYSDDGNFPLNSGSGYIGTSRQMFAFAAATVFSVEKSKIDSMDGNNVLEKAVAYFNFYPVRFIYKIDVEKVIKINTLSFNTQEILRLRSKVKDEIEYKLGDVDKFISIYPTPYTIQEIDDFYRHINTGSFDRYNFFRETNLSILSGRKYFIDIGVRVSHRWGKVGFGNGNENSFIVYPDENFTRVQKVIVPTQNYTNFGAYLIMEPDDSNGHYVDIKKDSHYYDLTEMFGEGNEPSEEELLQLLEVFPNTLKNGTILKDRNEMLRHRVVDIEADLINLESNTNRQFSEIESEIAGITIGTGGGSSGYYYRGAAPSIPVGENALGYNTFITQTWEALRTKYPSYITREVVNEDTSGTYDIYEYTFTPLNYKKTVFLVGGTHGDEYEGFWSLYYFAKNIAEGNYKHERLRNLRHDVRFVIIPIGNPWGMQNKSRVNSRGIDPNQNYDVNFKEEGYASSGSAPFSENESLAVKTVAEKYLSDFAFFADIHTDPYSPTKGNYITIVETSSIWDEGVKLTIDEIAYLKERYLFTTTPRPAIVNVSTGNGAWRYMEIVKGVPSLIWETSVGGVAQTGTTEMMTIGLDWLTNVITEILKVTQSL